MHQPATKRENKKEELKKFLSDSCGGRIRTNDLWVMSPTSYHCSTPRCVCDCKDTTFFRFAKIVTAYFFRQVEKTTLITCEKVRKTSFLQ